MSRYRLTRQADQNLIDIYLFTLEQFGFAQAEKYTESMKQCIEMLAGSPRMGRAADDIRPGIRRHEHESHVIFYREDESGILVLAIIHRRMRPDLFSTTTP